MTTFLAFVFVLGVLVFVHELGHFLAAKRVGIRVLKFQLGFNPTILSFRRGDTEYSIGALPLGGYVKMAGENPEDGPHGPRRRVPVEDQVGAVPGADHGPGDEPRPGRRAAGGRAVSGRRGAGLRGSAAGRRRGHARFAGREGRHPPRRPHRLRRRPAGRHLGAVLHRGRHAAEPRSHDHASTATAASWPGR